MRTASRQARHHLIAGLVQQTNAAADKGDLRGVYQVANQLSPKRRYEAVRIRSPDGHLLTRLTQHEQFDDFVRLCQTSLFPVGWVCAQCQSFNSSRQAGPNLPSDMTDFVLALLPKPVRSAKPADLRPPHLKCGLVPLKIDLLP